jgi:hypothetical protein
MKACCGKQPVYRLTLDSLFYKTREYPLNLASPTAGLKLEDVDGLRAFVKEKAKPLLDYLENNQRKLTNVGQYLSDRCRSSGHPVDHLIALLVLKDILPVIKNFAYDRGDMLKLIKKAGKNKDGRSKSVQSLMNRNLAENYLAFEERLIEILEVALGPQSRFGRLE